MNFETACKRRAAAWVICLEWEKDESRTLAQIATSFKTTEARLRALFPFIDDLNAASLRRHMTAPDCAHLWQWM